MENKNKNKIIIVCIIVVISLAIIGLGISIYLNSKKKNKTEETAQTNEEYDIDANRIFLINLFLDGNEKEKCLKELKKRIGINAYESSEKIYKENEKIMNFMKVYIEKNKV